MKRIIFKIGKYSLFEVVLSVLIIITNLIIIRGVDKLEYANYAVVISVIAVFYGIMDGGLISIVNIFGARYNIDDRFSRKIHDYLHKKLINRFLVFGSVLIVIIFILPNIIFMDKVYICFLVIPLLFFQLKYSINRTYFFLQGSQIEWQKNRSLAELLKLTLIGLLCYINSVSLISVLLINSGYSIFLYYITISRLKFHDMYDSQTIASSELTYLEIIKKTSISSIYFSLNKYIVMFLIVYSGSSNEIANFGVVSRLELPFRALSSSMQSYVAPTIARINGDFFSLKNVLSKYSIPLFIMIAFIAILAHSSYPLFEFLVGDQYRDLQSIYRLFVVNQLVVLVVTVVSSVNVNSGYILKPAVQIPLNLAVLVLLVITIGTENSTALLRIEIFRSTFGVCLGLLTFIYYGTKYTRRNSL